MSFFVVKKRLSKANEAYKKHLENVDKLLKLDNLKLPDPKERTSNQKLGNDLMLPQIAVDTINILKDKGVEVEGIFRISGSFDEIQNLKKQYEKGKSPDLTTVDVHVVSGLLKQFIRELPEPLLTFELYETFVLASNVENTEDRVLYIRKILKSLPTGNRVFLTYLIKFLSMVAAKADKNHMHAKNLAIVFAPSLLRPEVETMDSLLGNSLNINRILETMINHYEETFLPNFEKKKLAKNNEEYKNMRGTLARATALLWQDSPDNSAPTDKTGPSSSNPPTSSPDEQIDCASPRDRKSKMLNREKGHRGSLLSQKDMTVSANWSNFFKNPEMPIATLSESEEKSLEETLQTLG